MKKLILLCSFGLLGTFAMAGHEQYKPVNTVKSCHVINGYYNEEGEMVITHDIVIEGMSCSDFWQMIEDIMNNL